MNFKMSRYLGLGFTYSLLTLLTVLPDSLAAQSSVQEERLTFVRLTAEQYRNAIRDIFGESIEVKGLSLIHI